MHFDDKYVFMRYTANKIIVLTNPEFSFIIGSITSDESADAPFGAW